MKILVASRIDPGALVALQERHDVVTAYSRDSSLVELVADREALIFRSGVDITRSLLHAAPELRLLIRAGSGLDNLDLTEVQRRGISLHRIPGPGAQAVAELTFALMLAVARNLVLADRLLRDGHWAKSELPGHNLAGKTLGVIGLGTIGSRVARLGLGWGMRVIGAVENYSEDRRAGFASQGMELAPLRRVISEADFLTIHVPLTERTRGLVGRDELALMKPGSILVNVARGGVVDEEALRDALVTGRLGGAALDVHVTEGEGRTSPLAALPNVVLTPHIGASTIDAQRQIGEEVVRIIESFRAQESPANRLRTPRPGPPLRGRSHGSS